MGPRGGAFKTCLCIFASAFTGLKIHIELNIGLKNKYFSTNLGIRFQNSMDTFLKSLCVSFEENYGGLCVVSALGLILYAIRDPHCV